MNSLKKIKKMATGTSTTLNKLNLECSICKTALSSPKDLECGHTFCESCLLENVTSDSRTRRLCIICPVCYSETFSVNSGQSRRDFVRALRTNVALMISMLRFYDTPSSPTDTELEKSSADAEKEPVCERGNTQPQTMCSEHRRKSIEFLCRRHSLVMCVSCRRIHAKSCRSIEVIEECVTQKDVQTMYKAHEEKIEDMKRKLKSTERELDDNIGQIQSEFDAYAKKLSVLENEFQNIFSQLKSNLTPELFASITKQQKAQLDEVKSLREILELNSNDLAAIKKDYESTSEQFILLTKQQEKRAFIESTLTAATENLTSVKMRHVGIDVMSPLTKLGSDFLSEVHWKTTRLECRHSV